MSTPEEVGAQLKRIERERNQEEEDIWTRTILLVRIRQVSQSEFGSS
jgi:hypothetical protein